MGRVLIVDHDRDLLEALEEMARLLSYEVATAANASEALDTLQSFRPHVMVMSRGLPGMDGEELARPIRRGGDARTFIICLTGWWEEAILARIRSAGCDVVIGKPIDHEALVRAIADGCARAVGAAQP